MNEIKVIGIELAKSVFKICVWMSDVTIASNHKVSRGKLRFCRIKCISCDLI